MRIPEEAAEIELKKFSGSIDLSKLSEEASQQIIKKITADNEWQQRFTALLLEVLW